MTSAQFAAILDKIETEHGKQVRSLAGTWHNNLEHPPKTEEEFMRRFYLYWG